MEVFLIQKQWSVVNNSNDGNNQYTTWEYINYSTFSPDFFIQLFHIFCHPTSHCKRNGENIHHLRGLVEGI